MAQVAKVRHDNQLKRLGFVSPLLGTNFAGRVGRPAYARFASCGGFKSAEARSATVKGVIRRAPRENGGLRTLKQCCQF